MAEQGQFTTGSVLTAAELNAFTPMTCLSKAAAQSIPGAGAATEITFTTEDIDVLNWHSNTTNTARITPTIAGWYHVVACGSFDVSLTSRIIIAIHKNTTEYVKADWVGGNDANGRSIDAYIYMNGSTDYVRMVILQFSAGAVNFGGGAVQTRLQLALVRAGA